MTDAEVDDKDYVEHLERCDRLLPAWFVGRMTDDVWSFGLLLVTGQTLAVAHIANVRQDAAGSIWIDVDMLGQKDAESLERIFGIRGWRLIGAPTSRTRASINAAHIVCAVELADT